MNEICFNLWYYLDRDQFITGIAARQYFIGGDDQEKASVLKSLSDNDFKLLPVSLSHAPWHAHMQVVFTIQR
jgi:hypothetical protein